VEQWGEVTLRQIPADIPDSLGTEALLTAFDEDEESAICELGAGNADGDQTPRRG
jgi:hypothetical protein